MKTVAFLAAILSVAFSSFADYSIEDVSPHFPADMPIIWQAPTNHLPQHFWIYKKSPRIFSATTISNAIILASFQNKGFPKSSKYQTILWADHMDGEPEPPNFCILPDEGQISYSLGDRAPDSTEKVASDETAVQCAWNHLVQLGLDRTLFVKTNVAPDGEWGVFLPRQIDGIQVYDESEGFSFQQFGNHGKIRNFNLALPNLKREGQSQVASPQQIIACIRALKTPVIPDGGGDYFTRVKNLAKAKSLTITKITPYYGEGDYGETPTNGEPPKFVRPIAELEAVADLGNSNATVRLFSPITASEAVHLVQSK